MNILVTGSTGFIGSSLCKELSLKGHNVSGFSLPEGDIRNLDLVKKAMENIEVVFHLAALLPHNNPNDPTLFFNNNVQGTLNLLKASSQVKTFIYASTMSVYAEPPQYLPVDENHSVWSATAYGVSKIQGELLCNLYSNTIILRYGGAYGVGQDKHYATQRFASQALKNEPITIYGNGNQSTDFTYIDDIVQGSILALEKNKAGIYNIASGKETTIRNLAEKIIALTNSRSKIIITDKNTDRAFRFCLDIKKAEKVLGYSPLSLDRGLAKYLNI